MNYPYAIGTIKVIEQNILDKQKLSKLFKSEKSDFLKSLIDYGYGSGIISDSLEKVVNEELIKVKRYLDEISPEKKLTDLFFLGNDCLNIKVLYKIKLFNAFDNDFLMGINSIDLEALKKAILEDDFSQLSKDYAKLIKSINEAVKEITNPRLISAIIDNSIFKFIFQKLRFTFNETLKTYFSIVIDTINILSFKRARLLKWKIEQFSEMFVDNGLISLEVFNEVYSLPNEEIVMRFNQYYEGKISQGLMIYYQRQDINQLEKFFDNFILQTMKPYQYDSFGIGPIIYYYLKKQAEAKNIRLIYASGSLDLYELLEY